MPENSYGMKIPFGQWKENYECMKKGIWLSLFAVLLVGVITCAIWYINEEGKMRTGSKDSFIPYNSAVVLSINEGAVLSPEMEKAFTPDLKDFKKRLLSQVTDSLKRQGYVLPETYVLAVRVEGKSDVAFLYVMDNKDVISRGEVADFLNRTFQGGSEKMRRYDRHKLYTLKKGKETVYFAVCGGIILISDSDLYIEDGLKQFDLEESGEAVRPLYQNLNKYFSAVAGVNIFLNTSAFTDLLPLYVHTKKIFPQVDITRFFKWGALDGEFSEQGTCFNGFMHYGGMDKSYLCTIAKQQPRETNIDGILPSRLIACGMVNLSQPSAYFTALEAYRYNTGKKEAVFNRKQQFKRMFGKTYEEELKELLQGEFAVVDLAFNEASGEREGVVVANLKSGSLCKAWLNQVLKNYAYFAGQEVGNFRKEYSIDREKSFTYYRFPSEDFAAIQWGYIFEGIKNRYVLVEDNYLILASSEKAVKSFVQDYVHGSCLRDAEWYRNLKSKLAGKSNLTYFARTAGMLPLYRSFVTEKWKKGMTTRDDEQTVFSSLAWQWSNEGELLYNTLFLSTAGIQEEVHPHVLWQTKLDAPVTMKPVPVINHVTQEKELFVQDDQNAIYLINDVGRILWKLPVEGRINSEVYQVDLFKNGKLQYLFSTPSKMYLIDRNGNAAGNFPLTFRTACKQGITVYDYDNNRNYRIFAPCEDRTVYLYGLDGKPVNGWNPQKSDKPIVSKVQHFRIGDKDYIVFADCYRLYILDRKGKERVRVSTVFDLNPATDIYLTRKAGMPLLAFAGCGGKLHLVSFSGQTETVEVQGLSGDFQMSIADLGGKGIENCIFTDKNILKIIQLDGKILYEQKWDVQEFGYPYTYRFSTSDVRIGLTDMKQNRLFLLTPDGKLSNGFPIAGDSPFSIVFSGNDGFFLFAGADKGTIIKYKVQR